MIWMRTSLRFIDQGRGGRGDGCDWWRDEREREDIALEQERKRLKQPRIKKELIVIGDMFEYRRTIASQGHIIIPRHAMPTHQHHA